MPAILVSCPGCQARLRADVIADPRARLKCPRCGRIFVPAADADAPATAPPTDATCDFTRTPADAPPVDELLQRWHDLRGRGASVTPEEFCADFPHVLAEFKRRLIAVERLEQLAQPAAGPAPAAAGDTVSVAPPPSTDARRAGRGTAAPDAGDRAARTHLPGGPKEPGVEGVALPGYEVLGVLGRGGMGVVYRARQVRLNRVVAVKMILAGGHASQGELERFRTEAEAVARLQHPNIVQIHEVGEQDGLPFFSLEYCPGGSLAKKLAGTPLKPAEAARLVETLARAMHAAHQQRVIHRDLKPANILLDEQGEPKITDFGLAKKLDDDSGQTRSGAVMGTPSYMAPEQAEGKIDAIDPRTDVYALGAVLYELLTGRPPFKAATPLDTMLQVLHDEPVPPAQLQPKTPRDLETVCLKCLQKPQLQRYASAAALADDLGRFLRNEPIAARPVGRAERAWRWCVRNKAVAGLLAAVAAALLVGTVVSSTLAVVASVARQEADAQAGLAKKNAERAEESAYNATKEAERANDLGQKARAEAERANVNEKKALASEKEARANEARARRPSAPTASRASWSACSTRPTRSASRATPSAPTPSRGPP